MAKLKPEDFVPDAKVKLAPGDFIPGSAVHVDNLLDAPSLDSNGRVVPPKTHDTSVEDAVSEFAQPFKAGADTYSMGLLPRVLAASDTAGQVLDPRGPKFSEAADTYNENLTKRQKDSRETAYNYPSASLAGAFIPGPRWLGTGKTLIERALASAGTGAAAGNLMAPHDDPDARLKGTVLGGTLGGLFSAATESMGALADRFSGAAKDKAGEFAANVAAGGKAGIGDRMRSAGIDPEEQAAFGNRALDEGLIPTGLNPLKSPVETVLDRSRALKTAQGKEIQEALAAADAAGKFDPAKAQVGVIKGMKPANPLEAANSSKANKLTDQIGELLGYDDSFSGANKMKSQAWGAANFSQDPALEAQRYRKANGLFRDAIRDQVADVAGDQAATNLTRANDKYGFASKVDELATPAASRGGQSQQFSRAALALGNPSEAAGLMAGGLLKDRGPAAAARSLRLLSDLLAQVKQPDALIAGRAGGAASSLLAGEDDENTSNLKKRFGK